MHSGLRSAFFVWIFLSDITRCNHPFAPMYSSITSFATSNRTAIPKHIRTGTIEPRFFNAFHNGISRILDYLLFGKWLVPQPGLFVIDEAKVQA